MNHPSALTLSLFAIVFTVTEAAFAGEAIDAEVTVITSEMMTFRYKEKNAVFQNDVVVVDPRMKLYADKMTVFFDEDNKARNIKAEGNVIITQDDIRARGGSVEYNVVEENITMTGEPMIVKGKTMCSAELIKYDMKSGEGNFTNNVNCIDFDDNNKNSLKMFLPSGRQQ